MKVGFYITMLRGEKVAWLAGPYESKDEADKFVPLARQCAEHVDPRAAWDAFGVTRVTGPANGKPLPPGVLNGPMGL